MTRARLIIAWTILTVLLVSCSNQPSYEIHIYMQSQALSNMGYQHDQSWRILSGIDLADSTFVINDSDIESYDWSNQRITLTETISSQLETAVGGDPSIRLDQGAFVVTLGDARLYGGLFLQPGSARAIDYPAIYVESIEQEKVVFRIQACHPFCKTEELRLKEIEIIDIYDLFNKQGKLVQ